MSKFHDDRSYATHPGAVSLSEAKLRELEPALFEPRTFRCNPLCPVDHPTHELRERYAEHLRIGASEPAVVVSTVPCIVAVHSGDLDAAVLLRYSTALVTRHALVVGTRLLAVNTYADVRSRWTDKVLYAVDVIPGPDRHHWANVFPLVSDFLSDDIERIAARKREIPERDWTRLDECARLRIDRWGLGTARDGKPTLAQTPVRLGGHAYFRAIDASGDRSATAWCGKAAVTIAIGAAVLALWWVLLMR